MDVPRMKGGWKYAIIVSLTTRKSFWFRICGLCPVFVAVRELLCIFWSVYIVFYLSGLVFTMTNMIEVFGMTDDEGCEPT